MKRYYDEFVKECECNLDEVISKEEMGKERQLENELDEIDNLLESEGF